MPERLTRTGRFGLLTLHLGEPGSCPFDVEGVVVAQDRWLVMDRETPVEDSPTSFASLGRAVDDPGAPPGTVLVRKNTRPLRLWAVIHDLDRSPSCRREWVESALVGVLREVTARDVARLQVPPLGCAEGVLTLTGFLGALSRAVRGVVLVSRLQIWIPVPATSLDEARAALDANEDL